MNFPRFLFCALLCTAAGGVQAAPVTLNTGGDALGFSSLDNNGASSWSNATDPAAGNQYSVAVKFLRSPATGNVTFAGDSLQLDAGGALLSKNAGAQTVTANFILNGGYVRSGSGAADIFTLAGTLAVTELGGGLIPDQSPFVIDAPITGTSGLLVVANSDLTGGFGPGTGPGRGITFNGVNTFTGNLQADATGMVFSATSSWAFKTGEPGLNNTISGNGTVAFNGAFTIDLTGATTNGGDTWTLVNNGTLNETYGATFNIPGWTQAPAGSGNWRLGNYTFSTSTGQLVYLADSDSDGLPDVYEFTIIDADFNDNVTTFADVTPAGDFDQDGLSNLAELNADTLPADPDTDDDGLLDGPEVNGTNNQNVAHGFAPSNPKRADSDNDSVGDLEEASGSLNTAFANAPSNPNQADTDSDGFGDRYELDNGFNPNSAASKPVQPSTFTLLENFQGAEMVVGGSFSGLNGWSTGIGSAAQVLDEPLVGGGDLIGSFAHPAGIPDNFTSFYKSLSARALQIMEGNTGTLFLQLYSPAGNHDNSFGLSDVNAPGADFNNFEAQFAMRNATLGSDITIRDGAAVRDVAVYPQGRWFNVWIVADNAADTVKVYVESPSGQTGRVDVTPATDPNAPFAFRNGTTDALNSFFIIENAPDNVPVYFDNVYINPTTADLTKPVPDKPNVPAGFAITACALDASGNLTVTFAPGGTGYILASSDDLTTPFTPVTTATYDGVNTFTIPAASLNPGRDFFRVQRP
jgi:hypothetical protein